MKKFSMQSWGFAPTVFVLTAVLLLLSAGVAMAQSRPNYSVAAGNWSWDVRQSRLYQNDASAGLAKVNIPVPQQNGTMLYEFNVRYEGPLDDTHAGFGIHLFVDNVVNRRSWGSGNSYLLWLNYDEKPLSRDIPAGLSAQIYRSRSPSEMALFDVIDLNDYLDLLTADVLYNPIPVKIWMNSTSGEVRIYDPTDLDDMYYYFFVDPAVIKKNSGWVSLRTNSMQASFGYGFGSGM
jgi:hypothetical protein